MFSFFFGFSWFFFWLVSSVLGLIFVCFLSFLVPLRYMVYFLVSFFLLASGLGLDWRLKLARVLGLRDTIIGGVSHNGGRKSRMCLISILILILQ